MQDPRVKHTYLVKFHFEHHGARLSAHLVLSPLIYRERHTASPMSLSINSEAQTDRPDESAIKTGDPLHDWPLRAVILTAISYKKPRQFVTNPGQAPLMLNNYLDPEAEETTEERWHRQEKAERHLMDYLDVLGALLQRLDRTAQGRTTAIDIVNGIATEMFYCRAVVETSRSRVSNIDDSVHATFVKHLAPRYPEAYRDENGVVEGFLRSEPGLRKSETGSFTETMCNETRNIDGQKVDMPETSFNPTGGFESYDHLTPSMVDLKMAMSILSQNDPRSPVDHS